MAYTQQQQQPSGFGGYQYAGMDDGNNYGGHAFASMPPPPPPASSASAGPYPGAAGSSAAPYFGNSSGFGGTANENAVDNSYNNNNNNNNNNNGGNTANDMMWRMGLNYGQSLLQQGLEQGEHGARKYVPYWTSLRGFFAVDNHYVKRKLGILLFPFTRTYTTAPGGGATYGRSDDQVFGSPTGAAPPGFGAAAGAPASTTAMAVLPTQDAFAPDLYIPLMAVITYLLVSALLHGFATEDPVTMAFLVSTLTAVAVWQVLEVLVGKVLAYFLRVAPGVSVLALVALSGYKYVLICLAVILQRLLLSVGHTRVLTGVLVLYAVAAHVTFAIKSVRRGNAKEGGRVPPRAQLLAYIIAATQVPGMLWMCLRPMMFGQSTATGQLGMHK